jgi:capsular exopolysaccharide synthesis family protein
LPQYDINLREYWRILRKRKLLIGLTTIVLGVFSILFAILKAPTPVYVSTCSIKFERETTLEGLYARAITWSGGDDIETQISLIKSFTVFERVAKNLGLIPKTASSPDNSQRPQTAALIESLQSKMEVIRENYTNILNIRVKDTDPAFAQRLANNIALTYKDLHSETQMKRTTEAIKYIETQLANVRQKLKDAEEEFNRFSQDNQILSIDLQSEKLLARGQEVRNELRKLSETRVELRGLREGLDEFIKNPSRSDQNFYSAKAQPQYQAANDSLVGLMLKRDSLLEEFTRRHPDVVETDRRIVEHARKMKLLLEQQLKELDKKELDFNVELEELDKKAAVFMEKKLEFERLKRKVDLYHEMMTLLERKNQEALIRNAEKPEEVTIVKPGLVPTEPINPPRMATTGVMGVLIGLVVGLLAAFVVETLDTSLGAIEEVERTLRTSVLGVIPYEDLKGIEENLRERLPKEKMESISPVTADLIAHFSPNSMVAEGFRALRTNIRSNEQEGVNRTIVITSASPQEGKTFVSINLAITMAQTGLKTLLVGSDMRKPTVGKAFGVDNAPGLSEILLGSFGWRDTVKTIADIIVGRMTLDEVMLTPGLDNLHIITGGAIPPNPAELIQSGLLKGFIEEARNKYDFIIFDSPPILSTSDAAILGSRTDGVYLVYRIGSVSRGLLKRATTQLEQANCNIRGVILNGMKPEVSPDFQDYKYYRYYRAYGEEEKGKGRRKLGFTLFGKEAAKEGDIPPAAVIEKSLQDKAASAGMSAFTKYTLLVLAVALLGGGILWQAGMINPGAWIGSEKEEGKGATTPAVRKEVPKPEPKARATAMPKPTPPKIAKEAESVEPVKPAVAAPAPGVAATAPEGLVRVAEAKTPAEANAASSRPRPNLQPPEEMKPNPEPKGPLPEEASYPYSIYLGSSATRDQAKGAIDNYARKGLFPYFVEVDLQQKGTWFRVYLGQFKTAQEAEKFASDHGLREAEVKKTEYANLIGVYGQGKELEKERERISKMGHMPYVIKDSEGKTRLLVGAFITEAGAGRLQRELKNHGIDSEIVRR